jgi:hypothetical protein
MMYPNGRHMSLSPYKHFGPGAGLELLFRNRSDSMCRYIGTTWNRTSSSPEGYGLAGLVPAIRSGAMSALVRMLTTTGQSDLLKGGPIEGSGSWTLTGDNLNLGLVISMSGTSEITISGDGNVLKLTTGLDGSGSWTLTGDTTSLSMIIPLNADGSWSLSGISDLRGILSMSGEWTPFSELSPENLARSVWESIAADNDLPGTMGEKLNGAGSAGNPWTEVIESGLTAAQIMRIILAVQAGTTEITGTSVKFKAQDGITDRVDAIVASGERTSVTLNG